MLLYDFALEESELDTRGSRSSCLLVLMFGGCWRFVRLV